MKGGCLMTEGPVTGRQVRIERNGTRCNMRSTPDEGTSGGDFVGCSMNSIKASNDEKCRHTRTDLVTVSLTMVTIYESKDIGACDYDLSCWLSG